MISPMNKTVFHISKMDCPSEERIIRLKLEEHNSIKSLAFDIPSREMVATHEGDPKIILEKLIPLNFGPPLEKLRQRLISQSKMLILKVKQKS